MRILILPSARDDLSDGFEFYERQEAGLGDYFQESLFPTLNRFDSTREFIPSGLVTIGCCPSVSPTPSITIKKA
jgi:hypothetical protein